MKANFFQVKWKKLRGKIRKWRNQRNEYQLGKTDNKRALFIQILQKRYGYSKTKAVLEMNKYYSRIIIE
jgi:hypothetical protein